MSIWIGVAHQATSGTQARVGPLALNNRFVIEAKTADLYFKQGDNAVVATAGSGSVLLKVGQAFEFTTKTGFDHVSVIQDTAAGVAVISRLED